MLRLAHDSVFSHSFGATAPFRLGVEEELFLVDPQSYAIARCTDTVVARRPTRASAGALVGEMCDGVVELATPVCDSADQAVEVLAGLREDVLAGGAAALMGVGVHPSTAFGDVRHRPGPHYDAVAADVGCVLGQSAYCGLHVHIGMPDPETAIVAFNGMRKWVPLLLALSANSPFWHGRDSRMASCRTVRCHSVPRTGVPRAFRDWSDYAATMRELIRVADLDGPSSLWWDLRPHPRLGTLELRILDAQSSLDDLHGLVALAHCLVYHEALTAGERHPSKEVVDEACFIAARDGLDARLSIGGPVQAVHGLARHALDLAGGYAHHLGCADALGAVERVLADGNGAARQRRAFERAGLGAVLELLVRETAQPPSPSTLCPTMKVSA